MGRILLILLLVAIAAAWWHLRKKRGNTPTESPATRSARWESLLERDWPAKEARRLRTLRALARRAMRACLDDQRLEGLRLALALLPPEPRARAEACLPALVRPALALPPAPDDLAGLHRLRRAVRRVRHAREWLGAPLDLASVSDAFGALDELCVAVRYLGPDAVSAAHLDTRARAAIDAWRAAKPRLANGV